MKITYTIAKTEDGRPKVTLAYNGTHIGSIWGTVSKKEDDDFEMRYSIIHIEDAKGNRIATLWDTQKQGE